LLHKSFSVAADAVGSVFLACEQQEYLTPSQLTKAEKAFRAPQKAEAKEAQVPHP